MAPSDDLEYYYDNIDLEGSGEEVEEEANSSCFYTRQRHLGEVSKMIINDNDDEHVANNIVAKGVDYDIVVMEVINDNIIVSNDNVGAMQVVDGNILVFNDHVGATKMVGDTMVGDNQVVGGGETIILDVDIEVHNFFVDDIVVHPTVDAMESLDDTTDNVDNGIVKFANKTDEIAYKMPYKIDQFDSLSDLEKEHTKSVYFRNEEDKIRWVDYVMNKILGFYKEGLELVPEYLTRLEKDDICEHRRVIIFQEISDRICVEKFYQERKKKVFTETGDGVRIFPHGAIFYEEKPGSS
nr:retrotransposon Orf1 [Tanacetum cinerariifolium]